MEGNTADRTTLRGFLKKIESSYGKARRVWVMDRGIPTEEVLEEMRTASREIFNLVGTPRSKVRAVQLKNKISGLLMEAGVTYNKQKLHKVGYFKERGLSLCCSR
jgi:transposase